jgi:uncharacterized repeat protein (TIGR03803 family)
LVQGIDGSFYGATSEGGVGRNGTIFKITPTGKLTTLYSFSGKQDGGGPFGTLTLGSDGNLYGTAGGGGVGCGTIFRISTSGLFKKIYTFGQGTNAPCFPFDGLIQATDGKLYGTTGYGGTMNSGTIFSLNSAGSLTVLHSFDWADGAVPYGSLVQATDGNFYGSTTEGGAHMGASMCRVGSRNQGCGTVFRLSTGLGPFVRLVPEAGKMNKIANILGQGFTGTTSVFLNGTPMSFTAVSDTFIRATVPAGATTGYVTVATPTGTLTSNVPFHVIP